MAGTGGAPPADTDLEDLCVNVVRGLAMDAPQRANSGHPGTAMALAPLAHVLWTRIMRHDPEDPAWPDRDRFVLSCGHASILLYAMLHLNGYGLTLDDLRDFRQFGSKTPGHPERGHTTGVEVTTGPLGQGFANGVGLGVAERLLRARFGPDLVDHHTFVFCSDGCMQEGISHEAASLAGHLGLGRLVYVYDDNHITIDGSTDLSSSDDVVGRFTAYGWHVMELGEVANERDVLEGALRQAMAVEDRPSLLVLRSHIGWPSPNRTDTKEAHGNPLGADEVRLTKEILGLPTDRDFWVPDEVVDFYRRSTSRGREARKGWEERLANLDDRTQWDATWSGAGLAGWEAKLPTFEEGASMATRKAVHACVRATAEVIPSLVVGAADLTENTGLDLDEGRQSADEPGDRQVYFGIREHAMGAAMNGMALHGGVLPMGGTFFVFSDYMRAAVRLAALSKAHVVFTWSHDSVGLGEDGPTHQPIEHLAALRAMPGLPVVRPADANECAQAFRAAVEATGPIALIATRQSVPVLAETADLAAQGLRRGGYVLVHSDGEPQVVLIGTGSEVHVCVDAAGLLAQQGVAARVVSFPCWEWFADQDRAYRDAVLPPGIPRLAVEAGSSFGWDRYADDSVSIDHFGESAPGAEVLARFGYTPEHVAERARNLIKERS